MRISSNPIYLPKVILFAGIAMISAHLNAWTINILSPQSPITNEPNNILPDGGNHSSFISYLQDAGSTLTTGSLDSYLYDADAVIINVPLFSYEYSLEEINVITNLLNSNTRVLIFGENDSWDLSNGQLAGILGGIYTDGSNGQDYQTVINNSFPEITAGVEEINFPTPGKISPSGNNGLSLTSDDSLTLWGDNNNFLVFMDINTLADSNLGSNDNDQLAKNIAQWLSGIKTEIPEPSHYGLMIGIASLAFLGVRRRKK